KTNPKITLAFIYPSITQKYKNVPSRIANTPKVALFDTAWFLVYTSGNRTIPIALNTLNSAPNKIIIANRILSISVMFNYDSFLKKLRKGYCTHKSYDGNQ